MAHHHSAPGAEEAPPASHNSADKATLIGTLAHLWPYIWPGDRADLKMRVVWSVVLLLVAKVATSSRTTDQTTRILRSARSPGQIYGHRCASVPIRVALSAELWEAGGASSAPGAEW